MAATIDGKRLESLWDALTVASVLGAAATLRADLPCAFFLGAGLGVAVARVGYASLIRED